MGGAAVIIGATAGLVAVTCCGGAAVGDPAGAIIGDDGAGVIVRDVGLIMVVAAFDCVGDGGALPFSLIGLPPPTRPCCNVAVA